MVLPQPSKLMSWVRFPSAAHFYFIMKVFIKYNIIGAFLLILLISNSCFKSKEEIEKDKIEAASFIKEANKLFFENKYQKALNLYLKAINIYDFKKGEIYYKIGFSYDKGNNNLEKAEKYYKKALKLFKNSSSPSNIKYIAAIYFNLGIIAAKRNKIEEKKNYLYHSFQLLKKILKSGDASGLDIFRIAYYYMDIGDNEKAIKYFLKAASLLKKENPFHFYYSGAYFNIGIIYWKKEDINTALYYWKKALNISPDNKLYNEWYNKALLIKNSTS